VPADPTLADLARVIRRIEDQRRPSASGDTALEAMLGAEVEETEHGPVLVVRRRYPLAERHGAEALGGARELPASTLSLLSRDGAPSGSSPRLLYLDTETTGLAGGTGTYAFLVGVGGYVGDAFEVSQYFMRDLDEEPALLAALERRLDGADGYVTYNGRSFDLPLLETRFVLARRRFPAERLHVDLLPTARRLWGLRLLDCRLGTVEADVLGFRRDRDLPGALIPSVYFDWLRRKRPGELPRVFEHNRHDVLSLAAVLGRMAGLVAAAPTAACWPEELVGLGRLLEAAEPDRARACYHRALEQDLPSPARERLLLRLAGEEKRRRRWDEAGRLWEGATGRAGFDPRPWEELAKMYEHRVRDLERALGVVQAALLRARSHAMPEDALAAFHHRLGRLTRRLAGASADDGGTHGRLEA
jgi:uncharacterized protein YprB with RNaseH-like and TPR domain